MIKLLISAAILVLGMALPALAQDTAQPPANPAQKVTLPVNPEWSDPAKAFIAALTPRRGKVAVPGASVTLDVPDSFYFLDAKDARLVLEKAWGNPPNPSILGMLFPSNFTPLDQQSWGVTVSYEEDGHVSDKDAQSIDYDDLLKEMQRQSKTVNERRAKEGFEPVEIIGWAERPKYVSNTHKLYWARELKFGAQPEHTLNYDIRVLGRKGMLVLRFIASMNDLPQIRANLDTVLAMADFDDGARYDQFDPSIDKVAVYGIGGLIAGKVLAKTGLFAVALVLLKKFWFVLVAVAAGAVGLVRRMFGGKPQG